jgi:hypothetical protein
MRKLKITKEQAVILENLNLNNKKVMKVTKEQFDRIKDMVGVNTESANHSMTKDFTKKLPDNNSKNQFIKNRDSETKIKGIMESGDKIWSEFVNELYGLTESGENKYEKLIKLMEVNGYLENRKIKKSVFKDNKELAKDVILTGVYRLKEGASVYQAMEEMEKSYTDMVNSFKQQLSKKPNKEFSEDDLLKKIQQKRSEELSRRKERGELNEVEEEGIVGLDILNHFPFNQLPDTRKGADWQRGVPGWGKVYLPSIDSNGLTQIVAKDDLTYREVQGPKMVHKFNGYIQDFKQKFGEEPIFKIAPEDNWYDKIQVINPKYLESKEIHSRGVQAWMDGEKSAGRTSGLDEYDDMTEVTSASSSGSFVGEMGDQNKFTTNVPDELEGLVDEATTTVSTGNSQYATPAFASSEFFGNKGEKGKAPVNKGVTHKRTMFPNGKFVSENELTYPDGAFVGFDDCTKLNNNKEAQKGKCSVGAVDNVVKLKKKITETTEKTICNISTASNVQEITELLDKVNIPIDLKGEISDLLKNAMYSQTKLGNDLDILNTTLRKIQNILCIPR